MTIVAAATLVLVGLAAGLFLAALFCLVLLLQEDQTKQLHWPPDDDALAQLAHLIVDELVERAVRGEAVQQDLMVCARRVQCQPAQAGTAERQQRVPAGRQNSLC